MTKISILIPVYNRLHITKGGLNSLYSLLKKSLSYEYEVIVIDDGSTDGTSEWIVQNYPQTIILYGDGNLWWSGAINVGAKYAKEHSSTHLLLWNDDIKPDDNYFNNLSRLLENGGKIVYGSTIIDINTGKYWFRGCHYSYKFGFTKHIRKLPSKWSINCLTGMGTCLPICVLEDVGYWDDNNFPQYYGDLDYSLRAFEIGYRIVVDESIVLYNDTKASSFNQEKSIKKYLKSLFITQSRYNLKRDILFNKKHAKFFTWRIGFVLKHLKYLTNNIVTVR